MKLTVELTKDNGFTCGECRIERRTWTLRGAKKSLAAHLRARHLPPRGRHFSNRPVPRRSVPVAFPPAK